MFQGMCNCPQRNLPCNIKDVHYGDSWTSPPAVLQTITGAINAIARMGWNATVPQASSHGRMFFNEAKWTASLSSGVEGCMCTGQHHTFVLREGACLEVWRLQPFCYKPALFYWGCLLCFSTDCHFSIPPSWTISHKYLYLYLYNRSDNKHLVHLEYWTCLLPFLTSFHSFKSIRKEEGVISANATFECVWLNAICWSQWARHQWK